MYFSTASFISVIALSFLLPATYAESIDPTNIEPSYGISTTTTESQQNSPSHHPSTDQAPCMVIVNGQTIDTCLPLSTTEASSTHTVVGGTLPRSCLLIVGKTKKTTKTICGLMATKDSSAEMTPQPYEDPGDSSAAPTVAQDGCITTIRGTVFDICNTLTDEPLSTTVPQPTLHHPHPSCLVTDSHGNVHNTCHDQTTTTEHSSTTAAPTWAYTKEEL